MPGDKSLSHRAVLCGALADGTTTAAGWLAGADTQATLRAVKACGVTARLADDGRSGCAVLALKGRAGKLREPKNILNLGNSGTGVRLLTGVLAAQPFFSIVTGDASIRRRPMHRIVEPLKQMGAHIHGRDKNTHAPLAITGSTKHPLQGIAYESPVASAQVKSAILFAGLSATGPTTVIEPAPSRNHTEIMFSQFGADITCDERARSVTLAPSPLHGREFAIPGDFSSAVFPMLGAVITPGSELIIRDVGLNPRRTGALDVLRMMGADINVTMAEDGAAEPVGTVTVHASQLTGVEVGGDLFLRALDEFPALCIAAACAEGTTVFRDAGELRVKESDRIAAMATVLRLLGVECTESDTGLTIQGAGRDALAAAPAAEFPSANDHRVAMALAALFYTLPGEKTIRQTQTIATSFPGFTEVMESCVE